MKKIIFFFLSIAFYSNSWCKCVINCSVHYWKEAKTEVSNGGGGIDVFNEIPAQWSPLYTVSVIFYSGYEYNEATGENIYDDNSIIAVIAWDNGGYSTILIQQWHTNLKYITEEEIENDSSGNRINSMQGSDKVGTSWEVLLL